MSWRSFRNALALIALLAIPAAAQQRLTSPREFFGHEIGADYVLPNYTKFAEYWVRLSRESDRMELDTIGMTAEGRPQLMAIVSSPENLRNKERYRRIAEQLARAEGITEAQARQLAKEGKGIVWIDGGLHATEVLGAQQLIETSWQIVSGNDEETTRFRNDLIIVMVHANPDGMELVSNWYMREADPTKRSTGGIPRLYQKYVGHDNNRDFYLAAQPESENMNRVLYTEWYPQVMYNHHQTGPAGTVMFAPPFRDPMNFNIHPLIKTGLDVVGGAMHNRFVAEDKGGVVMRSGAGYSTWWNGGLRTTVYFHNMIGLLTETIGNPTPIEIPFIATRQIASADLPMPVKPGPWKFRQSVDYSVTANKAVLDVVSRNREHFLFNIWKMGTDRIAQGNRDSWTVWPKRIEAIQARMAEENRQRAGAQGPANPLEFLGGFAGAGQARSGAAGQQMMAALNDPAMRDPRAYVIPATQADFPTAVKFIVALQKAGIDVHRATGPISAGGKQYPAGSYVVKTGQAFGAHVLDMFEPQDHPNDFRVPGGAPTPPYDNAGWTLAMQMGVKFDRVLDAVTGPMEKIAPTARVSPAAGTVAAGGSWALSGSTNDAFTVVNRLLKAGASVSRKGDGTWVIANNATSKPIVDRAARELGLTFTAAANVADAAPVKALRVGLWDRYGGSMPSGWTRWILEQFEFPFTMVYPQELDAGNLNAKYDALIFVDGAIPAPRRPGQGGGGGGGGGFGGGAPDAASLPAEFRNQTGNITAERTVPQLKRFAENGGIIITIGSSTSLAAHLGLPVSDQLVERNPDGTERPLGSSKFYVPGSLLEVAVDNTAPGALGMTDRAVVMFDNSPVFRLSPDAVAKGVRPLMWFDTATPLVSGWAWGQNFLEGGVAAADAQVGRGMVRLIGPEALFRAQPHGTFKLIFNGLVGVQKPTM
ncbi:MAG: peptidase [Gemmatimonadales bacterium]|nr:peptidase [Gemmatimonadota bacterium]MCL4213092.1 peptidase [Gemmatimonadales bacterium]